jgi:hypothetical protein
MNHPVLLGRLHLSRMILAGHAALTVEVKNVYRFLVRMGTDLFWDLRVGWRILLKQTNEVSGFGPDWTGSSGVHWRVFSGTVMNIRVGINGWALSRTEQVLAPAVQRSATPWHQLPWNLLHVGPCIEIPHYCSCISLHLSLRTCNRTLHLSSPENTACVLITYLESPRVLYTV